MLKSQDHKPQESEQNQTRGKRTFNTRERGFPRRQCWECGSESHLARDCKYWYAKRQNWNRENRQRSGGMGEPMEINAVSEEKKNYWRQRL